MIHDTLDRLDWAPFAATEGADPVLRAKYIDYCSARLTEVFLSLPDERVYDLVEEAAGEVGCHPGTLGFRVMVRLVTAKLCDEVPLPEFEEWSREYIEDPSRFDVHLLGLWKDIVAESEAAGGAGSRKRQRPGEDAAGPE